MNNDSIPAVTENDVAATPHHVDTIEVIGEERKAKGSNSKDKNMAYDTDLLFWNTKATRFLDSIASITTADAKKKYPEVKAALKDFIEKYDCLETIGFDGLDKVKNLAGEILNKLYNAELKFRRLSFKDEKVVEGDEELKVAASLISRKSIAQK